MSLFSKRDKAALITLANLALWPGLGTVFARRWWLGLAQMTLSLAGAALVIVPTVLFFLDWNRDGDVPSWFPKWQLLSWSGLAAFGAVWVWAFFTSRDIRRASMVGEAETGESTGKIS